MKIKKFEIAAAESTINWVGDKANGGHKGTIAVKEGAVILNNGYHAGGRFTIDTRSITILDITDPVLNRQFLDLLASEYLFWSDKYPEAYFDISSVTGNYVEGDLTIKGVTHPIDFDVQIGMTGDLLTITAKLIIDRIKYGIKLPTGDFFQDLGEPPMYLDFELNISLTAKAVKESVLA